MADWETGKEMRLQREARGFLLRDVAEHMGLSAQYVSDLERGRRKWSAKLEDRYLEAVKRKEGEVRIHD